MYNSAQYQIVAQFGPTAATVGYQQILANTASTMNLTAMVGDILAFQGPYIAKEISTDSMQDYRCVAPTISSSQFTCTAGNLSSNNTAYHYLLQATIIQPVHISPTMFYNTPGYYSILGSVTQANVTTYSSSSNLPVIYGIDWVEVVGPSGGNINILTTFTVNVYPASKSELILDIYFRDFVSF